MLGAAAAQRGGSIPGGKEAGGHGGLGLAGKPLALADITNTGRRPNPPGSVADVLKENAKLRHLLVERTKVIEVSRTEMQKVRLMLQALQQKNLQLVQANSQMFAELNLGKERIKLLQHELSCREALLKVKESELARKSKTAKQQHNETKLLEIKARPSKRAPAEDHKKATGAIVDHLVEVQYVPSYTICEEPPQDKTSKRHTNKRKSESCEIVKDANTVQSSGSLHGDEPRKTLRRRSARLNSMSCEVSDVSCDTLHEDHISPLAPKQPNAGKLNLDTDCMYQKNKRILHGHKEVYLEEAIQEPGSKVAGAEAHKIYAWQPLNVEDPKPPQDRGGKRKSMRIDANKQKLESHEGLMSSNKEDCIDTKCSSDSSMPLRHDKRELTRRRSKRLDPGPCEVSNDTFEIVQEDTSAPSSSNVLVEQTKNDAQNLSSSCSRSSEEQVMGRRSSVGRPSRRAAEKVVSYREIPLTFGTDGVDDNQQTVDPVLIT
uniref:Shugoshin C-terminal domain-containing protein n=1 Tax=Leersia perrieri TaxID=77586 RepID=A0A0D9VM84_9ORYZ